MRAGESMEAGLRECCRCVFGLALMLPLSAARRARRACRECVSLSTLLTSPPTLSRSQRRPDRQDPDPARRGDCARQALLRQAPRGHRRPVLPPARPHARCAGALSSSARPSFAGAHPSSERRLTHRTRPTATGGSAIKAIEVLIDHGVPQERIIFLNLVSCPEGLRAMYDAYPQVKIVTAWVDEALNEAKYIVPGLGGTSPPSLSLPLASACRALADAPHPTCADFGDRYFTSR